MDFVFFTLILCVGKLEGLTVKVAENVAKELSVMEDDGSCTVSDVRMVLQAWLHLASFNLYDTGRVGALVEEINMMHQQVWPLSLFTGLLPLNSLPSLVVKCN